MEKILENFDKASIEEFISGVETDPSLIEKVKNEDVSKSLELYIKQAQTNKTSFDSFFLNFLVGISSMNSKFKEVIVKQADFCSTLFVLLQTSNEETVFQVISTMIEFFNMKTQKSICKSNVSVLPKFNKFLMDQMNEYNEDADLKKLFSTAICTFTAILGDKELSNVQKHKNHADFCLHMVQLINSCDRGVLSDVLKFISLLIDNYSVSSKFLYPNDFKIIMEIFHREMGKEGMIVETGASLFSEYAATLMIIFESKIYSKDYQYYYKDEMKKLLTEIKNNFDANKEAIVTSKVVLKILDFNCK